MNELFLGLDTSNYRTSICAIDDAGKIVFEEKVLLPVEFGKRGLMQSEAVFHHIKQLPQLFSSFSYEQYKWLAVGASIRPRPIESSYMPVFCVGESIGRFCSTLLGIPFYETSHQEGHIAAGIYSLGSPIPSNTFLAVHISGGTSEVLLVEVTNSGYSIQLLGGSKDLHAGQLIDRVGVKIGCLFPAGPELERIAEQATQKFILPSSVSGFDFSFSGSEAACMRALSNGIEPKEVAFATQHVIAKTIEKVLRKAIDETGIRDVLMVGGVASNHYIKTRLINKLEHPAIKAKMFFTSPAYSGDNAYGVACIARKRYKYEHSLIKQD